MNACKCGHELKWHASKNPASPAAVPGGRCIYQISPGAPQTCVCQEFVEAKEGE
jgi:hypothetical protein